MSKTSSAPSGGHAKQGAGTSSGDGAESRAYVTLTLGDQLCGVPIARIPLAPPEVAGNLNLRGRIVTAIDLRQRLRMPPRTNGKLPMSVVTELGTELYALQVDQVSEVVTLHMADMERNPPTLPPIWAEHSVGIYRVSNRLLVVLDVEKLLRLDLGLAA
jgi:purine-binding chemotaxis protein CheW